MEFEGEPGLVEKPVDERGPVLDSLEPVLDDRGQLVNVAGGEVAPIASEVVPVAITSTGSRFPLKGGARLAVSM